MTPFVTLLLNFFVDVPLFAGRTSGGASLVRPGHRLRIVPVHPRHELLLYGSAAVRKSRIRETGVQMGLDRGEDYILIVLYILIILR